MEGAIGLENQIAGEMPQVAIIVLNYNTSLMTDRLADYLNSHLAYPAKRVFVIDNGSESRPLSTTHALNENLGFTRGMYEAYGIASRVHEFDAYWFLHSDVGFEYGDETLGELVDVLFSSTSFAQAAPQHNSPHRHMELANLEAQPVPFLQPTATLVKRATIERIGFWDLELTLGWGVDYDYGYRVRQAGLLNIVTNRARITHKEHMSITNLAEHCDRARAQMHSVLSRKYGGDWFHILTTDSNIVPLILTCDRDISLAQSFVESYRSVQAGLARPVITVDISASSAISPEYLSLILSLNPRTVRVHGREPGMSLYDSVQEGAHYGMRAVLEETKNGDLVLFLEDDIAFSSRFLQALRSIEVKPDTGFVTLYRPANEYSSKVIDPGRFYGTQCVLFPRRAVEEIVDAWDDIKARIPPGYDIRWSRFLGERGYKLYSTDYSYVQHTPSTSRLHGIGSHVSNCYVG